MRLRRPSIIACIQRCPGVGTVSIEVVNIIIERQCTIEIIWAQRGFGFGEIYH